MNKRLSYKKTSIPQITLTLQIFQEGKIFVAYNPELDVSSCGNTLEEARRNLSDATRGFLKSAKKLNTLEEILVEAGFKHEGYHWASPRLITLDRFST